MVHQVTKITELIESEICQMQPLPLPSIPIFEHTHSAFAQ